MKLKVINIVVVVIALSLSGCAKKVLMKHAEPEAVKLCEESFYAEFYPHFSEKEKGELEKIKTPLECLAFIQKFWEIRDTDPTTPENEFKNLLEKRAKDIENDILFTNPQTPGFSFKNNRSFAGDTAKVYMLHGTPNYAETLKGGFTFVDMMIWIYGDERGRDKYRFLFYQKGTAFELLYPHFDILFGLEKISKNPGFTNPWDVYNELDNRIESRLFLYSLVYFSDDPDITIDKALSPPRPASEIARELAPKIIENRPQEKNIVISNNFSSLIPANLSYEVENENLTIKIAVKHENLDWILKNGEFVAEFFIKIIVWTENQKYHEETQNFDIISTKEKIEEKKSTFVFESVVPVHPIAKPTKINVYIKNNNKYNSWVEEIKR